MAAFDTYAVCPNEHVVGLAPFGDLFHVHVSVCPECGVPKPRYASGLWKHDSRGWEIVTMRWVRTGGWLKSRVGYWENEAGDRRYTAA